MKFYLSTLLFLLLSFSIMGQNKDCPTRKIYKVTAENGMKMRKGPGTQHEVVGFIPSKAIVLLCNDKFDKQVIEGKTGYWRRVKYQNFIGYMYDGFMESYSPINDLEILNAIKATEPDSATADKWFRTVITRSNFEPPHPKPLEKLATDTPEEKPLEAEVIPVEPEIIEEAVPEALPTKEMNVQFLTESYNYCGDILALDPGKFWYGFYLDQNGNFYRDMVDLQIIKSKYSLGTNMEFDIKTSKEEASYFLLGVDTKLDDGWQLTGAGEFFNNHSRSLYPGMSLEVFGLQSGLNAANVQMYATGNVKSVSNCPEIEGYKLMAQSERNHMPLSQNLGSLISEMGECGIPEIYWFGDFTGDQIPEIIFVSTYPHKNVFTLLTSDPSDQTKLYRKTATWTVENCE